MTQSAPTRQIAVVVEGHGEVDAVPILLNRITAEIMPEVWPVFLRPYRVGRDTLMKQHGIEATVNEITRKFGDLAGLLVLLDSDDDCPASLGPGLLARVEEARPGLSAAVVLAHREFEAWFLAAAVSLRGCQGLPSDLEAPADPESIRGCKEWLTCRRPSGAPYRPKNHQPGLAQRFDLNMARANSPSFAKFYRDVEYLITGKRNPP
ncbi:DUF4276 family protein [Thermopolyspora sp. NPDC052614]|uniref:DUF4276 family protein n=1 Tax=Thermopolyspora sp. NPDC052614 TaxID=3155682 RepID=UPI003444FF4B